MKDNTLEGKTMLYDDNVANDGTEDLRTVTGGKTYYLVSASLTAYGLAGRWECTLWAGDSSHLILRAITYITATYQIATSQTVAQTYPHPIPIAASTVIQVDSPDANVYAYANIIGWEE